MPEPIVIVAYDPSWPTLFEALRAPIAAALGEVALAIEHVGSTAVPGLAAKPIVDLDVVVASASDLPPVIERLAALGYRHEGDLGIPGREAFKPPAGSPPHHLYVCPADGPALHQHLLLRDALRTHPEERAAYQAVKEAAAIRFRDDRAAYTEAKTEVIQAILNRTERTR